MAVENLRQSWDRTSLIVSQQFNLNRPRGAPAKQPNAYNPIRKTFDPKPDRPFDDLFRIFKVKN